MATRAELASLATTELLRRALPSVQLAARVLEPSMSVRLARRRPTQYAAIARRTAWAARPAPCAQRAVALTI